MHPVFLSGDSHFHIGHFVFQRPVGRTDGYHFFVTVFRISDDGFLAPRGAEAALVEGVLAINAGYPLSVSKGPRLGRGPFLAYFTGLRQSFERSIPFIRPSCPIFLWPL